MDYGSLVGEAWRTTWRNRYLWGLALFAGGAVGVGTRDFGRRITFDRPMEWFGDRAWERRGDWRFADAPDASERVQALVQDTVQ